MEIPTHLEFPKEAGKTICVVGITIYKHCQGFPSFMATHSRNIALKYLSLSKHIQWLVCVHWKNNTFSDLSNGSIWRTMPPCMVSLYCILILDSRCSREFWQPMISRGQFWKMFALTLFSLSTHQQKARLKCAPVCRQMSTTLNCALWFTFFIFPHFSQGSCIIAVFSCGFCPIPVSQSDNMFHLFRRQLRKLSERESCVSVSWAGSRQRVSWCGALTVVQVLDLFFVQSY